MASTVSLTWSAQLGCTPNEAWDHFLRDLWIGGAGFGPRPTLTSRGTPDGIGCTRRIALGFGSGLVERIEAGERPSSLRYRVVNPGWRTFPVRNHSGTLSFRATPGGGTELAWRVQMDPLPGARPFVVLLTRLVIGRYLERLQMLAPAPAA